jgi:hypothetical protein
MLQHLDDPNDRVYYCETVKERSTRRYIERKLFEKTQAEDRIQFEARQAQEVLDFENSP